MASFGWKIKIIKDSTSVGHVHSNPQGAFFNYVDNILAFVDHLSKYPWLTFVKEFLYGYMGKSA